jgi:hypothetical protein
MEDLRQALAERVAQLRAVQRDDPMQLSFEEKLAFFLTTSRPPSQPATRRASLSRQPGDMVAHIEGSMSVKFDQSTC